MIHLYKVHNKQNFSVLLDGGHIWRKTIREGHKGDFWDHRTLLFLDWGSGYAGEFKVCRNSSNCTFGMHACLCTIL